MKNEFYLKKSIISTCSALIICTSQLALAVTNPHPLWTEFEQGISHRLLDWSNVGYKSGHAQIPNRSITHNVIDYGAIVNDGKNDRLAVQKAIDAASINGGVVFFPRGTYDFWVGPNGHSLELSASNVVIRGSGTSQTQLKQHDFKEGKVHFERFFLINAQSKNNIKGRTVSLLADAKVHEKKIKVSDTSNIRVGDVITLQMVSEQPGSDRIAKKLISPLAIEPEWTGGERFIPFELMVTVKKISSNTIFLEQPLTQSFLLADGARVSLIEEELIQNVGIEDLTLVGKLTNFNHHGSFEDDYGWNAIQLKGAKNSWIRNIKTTKMGTDVNLVNTGFSTVENIANDGRGHSALLASNSDFNLFKNSRFSGYRQHVISFSGRSAGNVFTSISNNSQDSGAIDFHGGGPSNYNLIENSTNLRIASAGAEKGMPHAGQHNTLWNIVAGKPTKIDDMFSYGYFIYSNYSGPYSGLDLHRLHPKTTLVGITNGRSSITVAGSKKHRDDEWLYVDSIGKSVKPISIYTAQRALGF
ncbi:glycosyl hydrolase family 28-related protein [Pseudoalteromonas sp. SWYJZ12]|uniref:glycosyl hydrolase family 28-related protein n=1 Tax=Pseudoalteromonas sp. SWYJZ12 TaxID=2792067 RepID=UPI0018CD5F7A|nr:glycosyl hydrolase family 28-related protein [Pseudoalteromonas sp. SWYJZ12]MBH0004104.1 hypothetical protein [Pseudoalteromonas sp. SWYJZ12]